MVSTSSIALGLSALGFAKQGMQNNDLRDMDGSVRSIERGIAGYLNGREIKSVLSPGDFSEFSLKLKAGQVIAAEARSEAFDPALEIIDDQKKVLAYNDDRYPGDQRPLLFWRCEQTGTYVLHVRCFHDKSGGQFFFRYKIFDSFDVSGGKKAEHDIDTRAPFLLRIPMKASQIKEVVWDDGGPRKYVTPHFVEVIAPDGLPADAFLTRALAPAVNGIMAPVTGDYYCVENPDGSENNRSRISVATREIVPEKLANKTGTRTGSAPTHVPALWELDVKKGEFIEASTPELNISSTFRMMETPDFSKYDLSKPESNPFFPKLDNAGSDLGPAFIPMTKRPGDNRLNVFLVSRDAKLWLASDGAGPSTKPFTLVVKPAASEFSDLKPNTGKLTIASTDFWSFDAKSGDVMTLNTKSTDFSQFIIVQDPDLNELRHFEAGLEQTSDTWRLIAQKPGRYLVHVSCTGNGGGGQYTLTRNVLHAKEFGLSMPANGEISDGQVQIWKFVAKPDQPLIVHWRSSNWFYEVNIYNDKGENADFQRDEIDPHNHFGILKVTQPQTFVIVLTGNHQKANYSIDLNLIPGYSKTDK